MRIARVVAIGLLLSSCAEAEKESSTKTSSPAPAEQGAFCDEHGVLEAVCTKCNPALIPVFQAKGDWCDEHGLPESFCPVCHPERGGKPTDDVGSDGAPVDGTKIRFRTKEAATLAGIDVAPAAERPGGARLEAVATIAYDATLHAEVNARAPGVVKKLHVNVGSQVVEGAPLATIQSAAVGADRSRLRAAATRVEVAKADYDRAIALRDKGVASEKEVLASKRGWEDEKAEQASARAALGIVGAGGEAGGYVLRTPLAGTVTKRNVTAGHMVDLAEVLFEIVDTRRMWVQIDLPEDQLSLVSTGQSVVTVLDSMPEREWRGTIDYISSAVDPRTRTGYARVALENAEGRLRANMYGAAFIELAEAKPTVMVRKEAVQRAGGATVVFVQLAQDLFETRRVRIGSSEADHVEVLEGVKPGEPVAVKGSFLLKTEILKGSIGAGCCDVE